MNQLAVDAFNEAEKAEYASAGSYFMLKSIALSLMDISEQLRNQ